MLNVEEEGLYTMLYIYIYMYIFIGGVLCTRAMRFSFRRPLMYIHVA